MEKGKEASFFLGANTPDGFYSLYDSLINTADGDFLWVIKGGPGCGKSSFMRYIGNAAQRAGLEVEYIYCSGDPKSLDGIYIPARRVAYVDGTAPHVIEPPYPGAGGAYLDLSKHYDLGGMQTILPTLTDLNSQYKSEYRRAYELLSAIKTIDPKKTIGLLTDEDVQAARRRASGAIHREMKPRRSADARQYKRFLSALTCAGPLFLCDTVKRLCSRVYLLDHELGLADAYLQEIATAAKERGYSSICCPDPLHPDKLEAVLLPELSLGYVAASTNCSWDGSITRHIRLDMLPDADRLHQLRPQLRSGSKLQAQILTQTQEALARAKSLHDLLEQACNPHVNFEDVYREADTHVARLLLN